MGRVTFTPESVDDVDRIWEHISQDNTNAANRFVSKLYDKLDLLSDNPRLHRIRPELGVDLRATPFGNYMVFYKAVEDGILLVNVLWGGIDFPDYFTRT